MTDIADVLIIGGGPAGLGAALALCRQNHSVIVFDSGDYRNKAAPEMHMVSTWDHRSPEAFRAAARAELTGRYPGQCEFVDQEVVAVIRSDSGNEGEGVTFKARDRTGSNYCGRKVILATGSRDLLPGIDGFDECWGRGIVHCLLCHGHEARGARSVGILALGTFAEPSTILRVLRLCKRFAPRVCVYTHGNTRAAARLRDITALVPGSEVESAFIERLEMINEDEDRLPESIRVVLEDTATKNGKHKHTFVVHYPGTEQASSLAEKLGVKLDAAGDIQTSGFQETSHPGIFAAGDCASPHKYFAAASMMGHMTGAGAAQQLQAEIKYI